MSKIKVILVFALLLILGTLGFIIKKNIGPVAIPVSKSPSIETLSMPKGFAIHVFAKGLTGARVMALDPKGRLVVSQTGEGKLTLIEDTNSDGISDTQKILVEKLDKPHGLAFDCPIDDRKMPCLLYVAEHGRLGRYEYDADTATLSGYKKLINLESSVTDRHFTRTLLFLPSPNEHILLVSVGSSCNVCHEEGTMRGKIMAYDTKKGTMSEYARGLRNSVFMTLNPVDGKVFATEMGRDGLGDNVPPDEINIIEQEKNYGWPVCYGNNIHDTDFDKNTYIRNPCQAPFETPAFIDLQAHSAPLGLAFVPEEGWPEEYWYNLLVAFHGSWNKTVPTGYKIMRIKLSVKGEYLGTEDFITGWLGPDGSKSGRPVDIIVFSGGVAYISDDLNGMIYRLERE